MDNIDGTYQICARCIMDTTDSEIEFDENGVCNHCKTYENVIKKFYQTNERDKNMLDKIIHEIKAKGKDKEYDCIIGLSGGVDSSYAAYIAKKYSLRPLAIHLDNGWDSELAVKNIENIVKKLGIDLQTYVIDWEEFKDLQLSFFKAGVVDIEMLTDHAIAATLYLMADRMGIKYIINGNNLATESILPISWYHRKSDLRNIMAIQELYGTKEINNFPKASTLKQNFWYKKIKGIKSISILNYVPYNKKDASTILENELAWKYYGGKHYESIFTRFYQGFILPEKFGIDKRKAHLSTIICSKQITRDEALEEIKKEKYDSEMLDEDKKFVLKKLGLNEGEFERYMKTSPKSHLDYPSDEGLFNFFRMIMKLSLILKDNKL